MSRIIRIAATFLSSILIVGAVAYTVGMYVWARRLDADYSFSYECCTQQAVAAFHAHFWSGFHTAAGVALGGCIGLAATLSRRTALRVGLWTLATSVGLLFCTFTFPFFGGLHDWSGAVVFTVTEVLFCAGLALGLIGGIRVGWSKLRHHNESLL